MLSWACISAVCLSVCQMLEREKERGCGGFHLPIGAFKNSLCVGAGTEMRTQYLSVN